MENLNKYLLNKTTNFARIKISFNEEEDLSQDSPIIQSIKANASQYAIKIGDKEIILYGVFNDSLQFLKYLDIHMDILKIKNADFDCFAFAEELFKDAIGSAKIVNNFNEEKSSQYESDYELLFKVREYYKKFYKKVMEERMSR